MSRRYQALRKSGALTALDPASATDGRLGAGLGFPDMPATPPQEIAQAVADFIHTKGLTHRFGGQGEWEIRTTLSANRRAWRYRSRVLRHGKAARKDFPTIAGDRPRQRRRAEAMREDPLAALAKEAVEVHFARCTSVANHLRLAAIPSHPRRWLARMTPVALLLCGVVALVAAYWLWKGAERPGPEHPPANHPERIAPTPKLPGHWAW
jgi:hypothetical protein